MKHNKSQIVRDYLSSCYPKWISTGKTSEMGTYAELAKAISKASKVKIEIPDVTNQFSQAERGRLAKRGYNKSSGLKGSKPKPEEKSVLTSAGIAFIEERLNNMISSAVENCSDAKALARCTLKRIHGEEGVEGINEIIMWALGLASGSQSKAA